MSDEQQVETLPSQANGDSGGTEKKQEFELYIKASAIDKETRGSCPICQQWFMIAYLMAERQEGVNFKVFTVQADCPPKNFIDEGWSKKFPVVIARKCTNKAGQDISGMMYDTFEELETFFDSINDGHKELKRNNQPNVEALRVFEDLYKHFNHFLNGKPESALISELKKVDDFLQEYEDCKFLMENFLVFADCHLLPRLQHIRVAGKAYRGFEIPAHFKAIWGYLKEAYTCNAFLSTMPSDQDIVFHYEKKFHTGPARSAKGKPTLEKFTFTTDMPSGLLDADVQTADGHMNSD